jgi:hypothetical protein
VDALAGPSSRKGTGAAPVAAWLYDVFVFLYVYYIIQCDSTCPGLCRLCRLTYSDSYSDSYVDTLTVKLSVHGQRAQTSTGTFDYLYLIRSVTDAVTTY